MRHLSTILVLIFCVFIYSVPAYSAYKGGITYSIPIEYKNLSESELKTKADHYFILAKQGQDGVINEDMTDALLLYSILRNINPQNAEYSLNLGILYDKINKDRFAKGNFSNAISVNSSYYDAYFYFGEFYYKRAQYKPALKYYKKALEVSSGAEYDLYCRLGDIYEKLGDTENSIKYLSLAMQQNPNEKLQTQLQRVQAIHSVNKTYYRQ